MMKYPVRPSGEPPRAQESPRTKQLRETRQKRLAFFENKLRESSDALFNGGDELQMSPAKSTSPAMKRNVIMSTVPSSSSRRSTTIDVRNNLFVLPEKLFPNGPRKSPILRNNISESSTGSKTRKGATSHVKKDHHIHIKNSKSEPTNRNGRHTQERDGPQSTRSSKSNLSLSSGKRSSIQEKPVSPGSVKDTNEVQVPPLEIDMYQDDELSDMISLQDSERDAQGILDGDLRMSVKSSPRTMSRFLEPQFEEDFAGLSLSNHQVKVEGLINGESDGKSDEESYDNFDDGASQELNIHNSAAYSYVKSSADLETAKLEAILGKDRFKRLLKNFEESDWAMTSDESNVVTPRSLKSGQGHHPDLDLERKPGQRHHTDLDLESVRTDDVESMLNEKVPDVPKFSESTPAQSKQTNDVGGEDSSKIDQKVGQLSLENFNSAQDYIRQIKENAKFAFSSDEILSQTELKQKPGIGANGNETSKSMHIQHQTNLSYKQWMLTEVAKSADATLQDIPSSASPDEKPFFERQLTFDDETESDFIQIGKVAASKINDLKHPNVHVQPDSARNEESDEVHRIEQEVEEPTHERQESAERHVRGIMQHMQRRELEKNELPNPFPPGQYSSPSLERYFSSLENISNGNVSSQDFDPIVDVDIEETPRNELKVLGQAATKSPRHSSKVPKGKKGISENGGKTGLKTTKPASSSVAPRRNTGTSKSLKNQKNNDGVRMSMDSFVTMATEETETSVWGEESAGHKNVFMSKKFGDDGEDATEIASDFWTKDSKLSDNKENSTVKCNDEDDESFSQVTETEVESDFMPSKQKRTNSSQPHLPDELVQSDQGIIGNTTNVNNSISVYASVDNASTLVADHGLVQCPDCEEMNKDYLRWCLECGAQLIGEDPVLESSHNHGSKTSVSLENVSKRSAGSLSDNRKSESLESVKYKEPTMKESLQKTAASLSSSLFVAALNPEESFRSRLEHHMAVENVTNPKNGMTDNLHHNSDEVRDSTLGRSQNGPLNGLLSLKLEDENLGESHYFEYSEEEPPSSRLSVSLKRELSIDLSLSRSMRRPTPVSPAEEKFVEMSEKLDFEYDNSLSPSKSLPPDLAEELSLNLEGCLEKSMPASKFKQEQENDANEEVDINEQQEDLQYERDDVDNGLPNIQIEVPQDDLEDDLEPEGHDLGQGQMEDQEEEDFQYDDIPVDDEEGEEFDEETDDGYKIFLDKLRNDPRFRPKSSQSPVQCAQGPSTSKRRPLSASNAKYKSTVQSKVRASWESEPRSRKWEKSAVAWGTYAAGELRPRSSAQNIPLKSRSTNSPLGSLGRPSSAKSRPTTSSRPNRASQLRASSAGRVRSSLARHSMPEKMLTSTSDVSPRAENDLLKVKSAPVASEYRGPRRTALGTYDKLFAMSPRVFGGEISYWLCLPDEIWLHILSYLSRQELSRASRTCKQLNRVATDDSLWRSICLKRRQRVSDDWLIDIGRRQPTCLALIKCQGERVTDKGLREMFRMLADSLQELNFTGCHRGGLTGDHILLHAASRCRYISHLDASWCNVSDNGLVAISEASNRLEVLCVNGCQSLTDDALHSLLVKHGLYLRELELFGCYNLTARTATSLINNCKGLVALNLGQCWALTDVSLLQLASSSSASQLESLDIQGCKQLKDNAVQMLVRNCPNLKTLSIACCPLITDASLADIAAQGKSLRSLDLHDCMKVTANGIREVALGCTRLQFLDLSNTKATHKSVSQLASYCHRHLEVLKINFCKDITISCLVRLVKNCPQLKKLYLYGVKGIRNIEEVRRANPDVWIEL